MRITEQIVIIVPNCFPRLYWRPWQIYAIKWSFYLFKYSFLHNNTEDNYTSVIFLFTNSRLLEELTHYYCFFMIFKHYIWLRSAPNWNRRPRLVSASTDVIILNHGPIEGYSQIAVLSKLSYVCPIYWLGYTSVTSLYVDLRKWKRTWILKKVHRSEVQMYVM